MAIGLFAPTIAHATDDDGAYGRYDGDLDLRIGAGVAVMQEGPALAAFASAMLLSSAGVYVHYTDAFDEGRRTPRSISTGLVIEPLFLARTAFNLQIGSGRLDLAIDSFAIGLGAYWTIPRLPTNPLNEPGLEFSLGFGLPILASATGPVLGVRAALRASPAAMSGAERFGLVEQGAQLSFTLAWRQLAAAHLIDARDRAVR
ncbi:MAG: hypothetical protein IPM54_31350 [Polyangiaceae bacterium]|nr:hypothetical protein [Polyangiaceae bacterium]